jgi:hypothetical protein
VKFEPETTPPQPRSQRIEGTAVKGEHGLYYIPGTQYRYTRRSDGMYLIYAPGCPEDGLEFAKEIC